MQDPRKEPDYIPRLFPSCDGRPFDLLPRSDRWRAWKARFLFAFYRINFEYHRLQAVRRRARAEARPPLERPVLQSLEKAILAKEALEDRLACRGIAVTPLYQNGIAINLRFQHPGSVVDRQAQVVSSASQSITFARPRGLRRVRRDR